MTAPAPAMAVRTNAAMTPFCQAAKMTANKKNMFKSVVIVIGQHYQILQFLTFHFTTHQPSYTLGKNSEDTCVPSSLVSLSFVTKSSVHQRLGFSLHLAPLAFGHPLNFSM